MVIKTVDGEMKTIVTMRDPVKSQNEAQGGDEVVNVDCEHISYEMSVMIITMRDPVKSQNVAQGGDKDYDVDCENVFFMRGV